ncbi:Smg-4/UPF3 family-domain-containing protein [Lophiotrema nucula]|uniref:Smg-4/UPF3 family-domain-containing protein n=1 Tax=Lophiotrema nucula TaxID=690887 RepID=A0A6A5ZPA5_9PLEO|nr:Smg-4/UPF3 family-domain-containing protein [Lophiotrema nucula]
MAPTAGVNGVLPVQVLQKHAPPSAPRGPKAPQPRLKLVLRRLPPGLTKTEFENVLGDEWKLGAGKVDWMLFKKGKISKDAAKPSRPARAYIHVVSQSLLSPLSDHIRAATFVDAAKSAQDSALVGPPVLEFSQYHRIPGGKKRNDNRQGTIDQDPEFQRFLEDLTNPIAKPAAPDGEGQKEAKVTTTPLIEALREKKANKDKAARGGKHGRGESKDDGGDKEQKKILGKSGKEAAPGDKSRRLSKAEKAAKEAVKVLNKEAASSKDAAGPSTEKATPSPAPERKRGNASIAKSMLQRDLGIGPAANRRRGTKRELTPATQGAEAQSEDTAAGKQRAKEASVTSAGATASDKTVPASPKKESARPSRSERRALKATLADKTNSKNGEAAAKEQAKASGAPAPVILKKPQATQTPTAPKGPAASRAPPTAPAAARASASQSQATPAKTDPSTLSRPSAPTVPAGNSPAPIPTGRQAFLKHANPSQGITEPLIEEALKVFGAIEKVEIDKRKGFAYVDFAEPEGLAKAIAGSPIPIAQGAVQVLERKEKAPRVRPHLGPHVPHPTPHGPPTGPARGRGGFMGRGRGRGGARGGGHIAPNAPAGPSDSVPPAPSAAAPAPAPVAAGGAPT